MIVLEIQLGYGNILYILLMTKSTTPLLQKPLLLLRWGLVILHITHMIIDSAFITSCCSIVYILLTIWARIEDEIVIKLNYIPYKVVSDYSRTGLPWWKQNAVSFHHVHSPVNLWEEIWTDIKKPISVSLPVILMSSSYSMKNELWKECIIVICY